MLLVLLLVLILVLLEVLGEKGGFNAPLTSEFRGERAWWLVGLECGSEGRRGVDFSIDFGLLR